MKPDVVGVDRVPVVVRSGATRNLEGTSLATPHVAGLAALVKQRNPGLTPARIAAYLKDNALPRGETVPNNTWGHGLAFLPHIGPVITGDPRIGGRLTADTDAVYDIDNLPDSPTFTYQWIRVSSGGNETNISGATSATYTPVQADVGSTLKVKVSFTDRRSNAEEQTSRASLRVVPVLNRAASKPTIAGTLPLRVTATVTASTSSIRDPDGVNGVTFEYQWVQVDGGTDIDIPRATESSYILRPDDEGKKVKVKVSFADNNRNAETVVSDESAVVGSAPNRDPAFSATTASREVEETALAEQDIGLAIAATDLDNDTLTYSIRGGSTLFAIAENAGQLQTKGALNYEGTRSYSVVVQVTDNKDIDGMADTVIDDTIMVSITVTNEDEPAIIIGPQTVDWNENTAGTVATFSASDPDAGDPVFLTLIDGTGDEESFEFSSGRLSFKPDMLPDFEGLNVYTIELGADTDPLATNYDTTYAVTINIRDVDEPADITLSEGGGVTANDNALTVEENHDGLLATFRARDPENTAGLTYVWSVVGTDRLDFAFTPDTDTLAGELSFAAVPDYEIPADSNRDNTYNITVQALDSEGKTGRITVTVTVQNVDEPPTITGPDSVSIEEGSAVLVGTYIATDPEGDTIAWRPLEGGDRDEFEFNDSNGRLSFKETPDYEAPNRGGDNEYNVTLGVTAGTRTTPFDVTVTVTNVDEPGGITLTSEQPLVGTALTATVTDPDGVSSEVWQWRRSMSRNGPWTDIADTDSSYTPVADDLNQYLQITATYTDVHGHARSLDRVPSEAVDPAVGQNHAPDLPDAPLALSVREDATPNTAGRRTGHSHRC